MLPRHYTYYMIVKDEDLTHELMEHDLPWLYVGVRTCRCLPKDDPYMGSSRHVDYARSLGIEFEKYAVEVHKTRKRANQHEIQLLQNFKRDGIWEYLFNRVIPGEFGFIDYTKRLKPIITARKKGYKVAKPRANRRGGPSSDYVQTEQHKARVGAGVAGHWALMQRFCREQGIASPGKGACNVNRTEFQQWRNNLGF